MEKLENDRVQLSVLSLGAEIQHLIIDGSERLWQGDPAWWARRSPVLFPVVGKCHKDRINAGGKAYAMGQHGFARDMDFKLREKTPGSLTYVLQAGEKTLSSFPYPFTLEIKYSLLDRGVKTEYMVTNTGSENMPFSIGAHPGFNIAGKHLGDCLIEFEKEETSPRYLLDSGLFNGKKHEVITGKKNIILDKSLFDLDAIVLKNINSQGLKLFEKGKELLEMRWHSMPHLGIWTRQGCEAYLCLEPWAGYSDEAGFEGEFSDKQAINHCPPGESRHFSWEVHFATDPLKVPVPHQAASIS